LAGVDEKVADELSLWRYEPLVDSALDTFGNLSPTAIGSEEWDQRVKKFVDAISSQKQAKLPPVDDTSGAAGTEQEVERPHALREQRDEATLKAVRPSHTNGLRLPPDGDGIGR
jgi:hypothetical protein